jgi:hypothetical protein
MTIHLDLARAIETRFAAHLATPPDLKQDALVVQLANGVTLLIRYAAADAYSLRWTVADQALAIDTAPRHGELGTAPNHLHTADGQAVADPVTRFGADPWDNVRALIDTLLRDPLEVPERRTDS